MLHRRRVRLILLLLILLGWGGGYWLTHRDGPSLVLRTVTVGTIPGWVAVDERTNGAFVTNSADHTVSVLDATTGQVRRTVALRQRPTLIVSDVRTGRIFVLGDDSNTVTMLDAASGAPLGTVSVPTTDLVVDDQTGRVFVAGIANDFSAGTVVMLDGGSGRVLRTATVSAAGAWGLAVNPRSGRVFVANHSDGTVIVADASTGHVIRSVAVGSLPAFVAVDTATGHVFVTNNGDNTVAMLDGRSGRVLRTTRVSLSPARVVVDPRTGHVFVVHSRAGPQRLSFEDTHPTGTTMLDTRSGAVLGSVAVGGSPFDEVGYSAATNIAVDERRGRVFVINGTPIGSPDTDGSVAVIDARTGRVLRTIPVGRHPISLAVNEMAARLFVVNTYSGCPRNPSTWNLVPSWLRNALPFLPAPSPPNCLTPGTVTVIDTSRL